MAYSGWKNWETWNAALWINNDAGLYGLARRVAKHKSRTPWRDMLEALREYKSTGTPDGVRWESRAISVREMNVMLRELVS